MGIVSMTSTLFNVDNPGLATRIDQLTHANSWQSSLACFGYRRDRAALRVEAPRSAGLRRDIERVDRRREDRSDQRYNKRGCDWSHQTRQGSGRENPHPPSIGNIPTFHEPR